jgi:hypothetical protein
MARARNIKPGFFANADLAECSMPARLLFIGLWTVADRAGRLEDRPKQIKYNLFPTDDIDVDAELSSLADHGFIIRYQHGESRFIQVVNFTKHQTPHIKEAASTIPAPDEHGANTEEEPDGNVPGTGPTPPDSLNPESGFSDSLNPDTPPTPSKGDDDGGKPPQRGTRLSVDAELPESWIVAAETLGYPSQNIQWLFEEFRDYWSAVPGQKGIKLDWLATWRNRVRDRVESGRLGPPLPQQPGKVVAPW